MSFLSFINFFIIFAFTFLRNGLQNNTYSSLSYLLSGEIIVICIFKNIKETRLSKPDGFF